MGAYGGAAHLCAQPRHASCEGLAPVRQEIPDAPDLVRCWLQNTPAHSLPNLAKVPTLIVTSEASYHAPYDHCTVKYLQQAGVRPKWIKLPDVGIRGNGHMMMLEKNNMEIAAVMARWLADAVPVSSTRSQ